MKELLKKYKNGTLTVPDEQDAFVHELLQIRAQRMQKQQDTMVYQAPKQAIVRQLSTYLRKVDTRKYFAAAACIVLTCFTFWKLNAPSFDSQNELMADISIISKNLKGVESRTRGALPSQEPALSLASKLYDKKDFQDVINELEGKNPINENEYLYLGLAYSNLKNPDFAKALDCFNHIQSADYKQHLTMMKALCHIGLNQKGAARLILEGIRDDEQYGNDYRQKAKKLLAQ
jgi:hypothetical protein